MKLGAWNEKRREKISIGELSHMRVIKNYV